MWYNRLSDFLLKKEYVKNNAYPCVFIKEALNSFYFILIYVDNINIIGTCKKIKEANSYLKMKFEMKDLGKPSIAQAYRLSISLKKFL